MSEDSVYEFRDEEIDFSAIVIADGDLFRIGSDRFDCVREELYESLAQAKTRIYQCVLIAYQSDIAELKRKLARLEERRSSLKVSSMEESLFELNSADIPF